MKLQEGKITLRDLSLWFGYNSPDGFSKASKSTKEKKLDILKAFADYHFEGKTLIIDKVKIDTYSKAYETVEREFPKEWGKVVDPKTREVYNELYKNKIDTCARVGSTIYYKNPEVRQQVSQKTAQSYAQRVKVKMYGHNYLNDEGILGSCSYVRVNEDGTRPLNDKEQKIVQDCAAKANAQISELQMCIEEDYRQGVINEEEKKKALGNLDISESFDLFVDLVIKELGYYPEKRTKLENRAWKKENKNDSKRSV